MGLFFSAFIIISFIRVVNKHLDKEGSKLAISENPNDQEKTIDNYFPFFFHLSIAFLLVISCFFSPVLSGEKIHVLVSDVIFQFSSTLLIVIISMINPFVPFSPETRKSLEGLAEQKDLPWIAKLLKNRNWQLLKGIVCILIIIFFIYKKYLVFPNFNQSMLSTVAIVLIVIFIVNNIIQLIKNPIFFKRKTMFRLSMLYRSFKLSFFISIILIIAIFICSAILQLDAQKLVNPEGIALLVYNVVMAFNEYKIVNFKSGIGAI